jgi:hypothetical protein
METEDNTVDELLEERCALQAQVPTLETALASFKPCAHNFDLGKSELP